MTNEYIGGDFGNTALRNPITQNVDGALSAPDEIIPNVAAARTIFWNLQQQHGPRIFLYAQIMGLIAGNPPYDSEQLNQEGLGHMSNFNTMDANATYKKHGLALWSLINQVDRIAKFSLVVPPSQRKNPELTAIAKESMVEYADIISGHFNDVIRSWPNFKTMFSTMAGQLAMLGVSPVIWDIEKDWRFRTIELSRFYIKDQAAVDTSTMTAVCVESIYTVQQLYQIYQKAKKYPQASGWNVEELEKFLLFRANSYLKPDENGNGIFDMVQLQRRLDSGSTLWTGSYSDDVRLISMLYQQYDGTISHFIYDKYWDSGNGEFLFKQPKQFKSWDEVLLIFTRNPDVFTIHENKGIGHEIFASAQAIMQLDNSAVDTGRWAGTPILRTPAGDPAAADGIRLYQGAPTNIGVAEFVNNTIGANLQQIIGVSQFMTAKTNFNLTNSGADPSSPDKNVGSVSDDVARQRAQKEAGMSKDSIDHFYSKLDVLLFNIVAKMLASKPNDPGYEYAKEWKDRCIADGVPEEIFSIKTEDRLEIGRYMRVSASRVAGDGSDVSLMSGLSAIGPIVPTFGAREQRNFSKLLVRGALGKEYVDEFVSPQNETDAMSSGASQAGVENAVMELGKAPVYSPQNDHKAHFATHLALANYAIKAIQQQQFTPIDADKIFTQLIPHMQEHWGALLRSPFATSFVQQNKQVFKQVTEYAMLNRRNAAKMMQAELKRREEEQARQQQVMTEEQLATMKAQGEENRANFKAQATVERAKETASTRGEIMKESARAAAANERLKIQLKADAERGKQSTDNLEVVPEAAIRDTIVEMNGATPAPFDFEKPVR